MKRQIVSIVIAVFLFSALLSCGRKPKGTERFPQTLPHLHLIKILQGKEAIEAVNKLHGKKIPLKRAWVAYYQGAYYEGNWNEASIWISESFSPQEAKKQTEVMMQKMLSAQRSPFYNFKEKNIKGIKVYTFFGLGQQHAVFQRGSFVYWISANFEVFDQVLDYFLEH